MINNLEKRYNIWITLEYNLLENTKKYYSSLINSTTLQASKDVYQKRLNEAIKSHNRKINWLKKELTKVKHP
jgi:hypothetical protein